jgi:hypothetical protein
VGLAAEERPGPDSLLHFMDKKGIFLKELGHIMSDGKNVSWIEKRMLLT